MGRQMKKNPELEALQQKNPVPITEGELDDVTEEEAFVVEVDDETNQVVLAISYREKFGDPVNVDIDHVFTPDEAKQFAMALVNAAEEVEKLMAGNKVEEKAEDNTTDAEVENGNTDV